MSERILVINNVVIDLHKVTHVIAESGYPTPIRYNVGFDSRESVRLDPSSMSFEQFVEKWKQSYLPNK